MLGTPPVPTPPPAEEEEEEDAPAAGPPRWPLDGPEKECGDEGVVLTPLATPLATPRGDSCLPWLPALARGRGGVQGKSVRVQDEAKNA